MIESSHSAASSVTQPSAVTDTNRRLLDAFVDFINTADEGKANRLVSPSATFFVPGRIEPLMGPPGYMQIIGMMRSGFPDIQWTLEDAVFGPDKIAARFTMHGTHNGSFLGVSPTGKAISVTAINIYYLRHGQIVGEYGQPDFLGLMRQIGAIPG